MKTEYAVSSIAGSIRKENQDNYYLNGSIRSLGRTDSAESGSSEDAFQCFAVCDGMGGEEAGDIAALLAVEALREMVVKKQIEDWESFIQKSNEKICLYQEQNQLHMGTTMAGILIKDGQVNAVNVGDSRIYHYYKGKLRQLSVDDTEFRTLVEAGFLKPEDFAASPSHNRLTQNLGIPPEELILDPHFTKCGELRNGDIFLLCSDGLYGVLPNDTLKSVLESEPDLTEACDKLTKLSLKNNSMDNVSILLVRVLIDEQIETDEETADLTACPLVKPTEIGEQLPNRTIPKPKKKKKLFTLWIFVAVIILLALGAAVAAMWHYPVVGNVIGMTETEAAVMLTKHGFTVQYEYLYDESVTEHCVIRQSVESEKRLARGTAITLDISKGVESAKVPLVIGLTWEEAQTLLEEAELEALKNEQYNEDANAGVVITQSILPDTTVSKCSSVTVTVSLGSKYVKIPSYVGKNLAKAEKKLSNLGLTVIVEEKEAEAKAGTVLEQSPENGYVERDGTVTLTVSTGKTYIVVPDIMGKTLYYAEKLLDEAGLQHEYDFQYSSGKAHIVTYQEPSAGSKVPSEQKVFFYVSKN